MDEINQILINNDQLAWEHIVNKNLDAFGDMLAEDYQGVYSRGTTDKAGELKILEAITVKSAEVLDSTVQFLDENSAVVTSTVKVEMIMPDGAARNETLRTTTVNARRGDQWLCVYHTDTAILPVN